MAQQRAKIIKQLESDGVINMNKELYFPRVPQRIAIISSETAAGYTDFVEQLKGNGFGYSFDTKLFPAIMQGNDARESIISAFNNIFDDIDAFDTVVLIRGGGSKSDLSCFDDYELAYYITQFPMPVLTGIGHERDESIADIVAHKQLKTPTAVAEFLINKIYDFDALIDEYDKYISDIVRGFFNENNLLLNNLSHKLQLSTVGMLQRNINAMDNYGVKLSNSLNQLYNKKDNELNGIVTGLQTASYGRVKMEGNTVDILSQRLKRWTRNYIDKKENKLQFLQEKVDLINPENILKRGYSIVIHNKEVVTDANSLKLNKNIKIKFAKGYIESVVTKIEK
jgi:exodeoxyribonuclease VII large subunit